MTERIRDEGFFKSTGIDTSDPNWQIKSFSENDAALHGFIVDANQRMGIINYERIDQAVSDLDLKDYTQRWVEKYTINDLLGFLHESIYFAENPQGEREDERRSSIWTVESICIDVATFWRNTQKEKALEKGEAENHLEIGTSEAFISEATSFSWAEDSKRLSKLAKDVSDLKIAYEVMKCQSDSRNRQS